MCSISVPICSEMKRLNTVFSEERKCRVMEDQECVSEYLEIIHTEDVFKIPTTVFKKIFRIYTMNNKHMAPLKKRH